LRSKTAFIEQNINQRPHRYFLIRRPEFELFKPLQATRLLEHGLGFRSPSILFEWPVGYEILIQTCGWGNGSKFSGLVALCMNKRPNRITTLQCVASVTLA
jgi:hypothetical protein